MLSPSGGKPGRPPAHMQRRNHGNDDVLGTFLEFFRPCVQLIGRIRCGHRVGVDID